MRTLTRHKTFAAAALSLMAMLAVARITANAPAATDPLRGLKGTQYLFEAIRSLGGEKAVGRPYAALVDFLPNAKVQVLGSREAPVVRAPGALVALGEVTDVRPGRAFVEGTGDATEADRREVAFGAAADWRTVHFTVRVHEAFGQASARELNVALAVPGFASFDQLRSGLLDLGRAVFVLHRGSPVFSYAPGVWAVTENGSLIAPVTAVGSLSLPAVEGTSDAFLRGADTLAALRASAAGAGRLLTVKRQGSLELLEDAR